MAAKLTIVFPCYNSSSFIGESFSTIDAYLSNKDYLRILFIEDCGTDNTFPLLNELTAASLNKEKYTVLKNKQNLGKGGTIKHAIDVCTTELMVFTDPDLAYDLSNIDLFYKTIAPNELLIANRVHPDSRYLIPPSFFRYIFTRHLSSRIYNKLAQILLIPGIEDNQAGLKMFFVNDIKPLLIKSTQNDFSFDLEMLVMVQMNGIKIKEMPVNYKYDHETTTVAFISDSFNLFNSLIKIFIRRMKGDYKVNNR
jgi:glycosyltransferase involved in cell wall biosynthesis